MVSDPGSTPMDRFMATIRASHLVALERLQNAHKLFQEKSSQPTNIEAFRAYLVSRKVITEWQGEKLIAGKFKGFFLDHYKLVNCLSEMQYVAEDMKTRDRVILEVSKDGPGLTYRVVGPQ
jgi:hypothetical protein